MKKDKMSKLGDLPEMRSLNKKLQEDITPKTVAYLKFEASVAKLLEDLDAVDKTYIPKKLLQCTLPHSDPEENGKKDLPIWSRSSATVCLSIQPAFVAGKKIGFPYGAIPRLLFFWMTEQVQLTKSRRDLSIEEKRTLVLGTSLNDFMRQLGLNPATGGGKRGDAKRWRNQAIRLFRSHIALDEISKAPDWKTMEVAEAGRLWGDPKHADQESLFPSWVLLTEKMYRYLVEVPVPIDMRALKALKGSSLALDLYAYICHRAFVMFKRNEGLEGEGRKHDFIAWRYLLKQFGTGYQGVRAAHDFQKEAKRWMMKIEKLYPGLEIRYDKHKGGGGFWIDATRLAVPERNVFFTGNDIVAGGGIVACMAVKHGSTLILSDNDKLALTEPRPETPETSKEG